jgi:hypothetical protein
MRSYVGYVVTETKNIELPGNTISTKGSKETSGCFDERCAIIKVTLVHHGHIIKADCQVRGPKNHCSEIEVGNSYSFSGRQPRTRFGDLLSLDNPFMALAVEEEHE